MLALLFWLSVVLFVGSVSIVLIIVTRIPPDFLTRTTPRKGSFHDQHPVIRVFLHIVKNLFGLLLIVAGVVMLFIPGQGTLFIVLGILMLDFPGKQKFERRLLGSPRILRAVNKLREKTGHLPLESPTD